MRTVLTEELERAGYEVVPAEDGMHLATQITWCAATRCNVDAVVTDVQMPGANGLRIVRALREQGTLIPVVMITAFGSADVHAEAARLGAPLLDKPFEIGRLVKILGELIEMPSRVEAFASANEASMDLRVGTIPRATAPPAQRCSEVSRRAG